MMDNKWEEYQYFQHSIIEKALTQKNNEKTQKRLLKSLSGSLNNLGIIYKSKGNTNKALEYYKKSLNLQNKIKDKYGLATAYNNIGLVYKEQGDIKKALNYYNKSLKVRELLNDKEGISMSYNNIAMIYQSQDKLSKALIFHQKSLKLREEINHKPSIALSLNNIGTLYNRMNNDEKALEHYIKAKNLYQEIGNKSGTGFCLNNIGSILFNRIKNANNPYIKNDSLDREIDIALNYFLESLELRKEINYKDGISESLYNIAWVHFYVGKIKQAKEIGLKSLKLSKDIGYPENIKNAAGLLSEVYLKEKNGLAAMEMFKLHITMRDSINNLSTQKLIIQQQAKHEYEKQKVKDDAEHNKLIAIEKEKKEKQQILTAAAAGGLGLVIVFLIFVFNRLRITRKQKIIIEEQKEAVVAAHFELEEKNQEILDSINYAKRIQSAILPETDYFHKNLKDSFILYKPKDIVAGDFYWMEVIKDQVLYATADCTGHGVPGAMVSVVCSNSLNQSVKELETTNPAKILEMTRSLVKDHFNSKDENVRDGMDITLCVLNSKTNTIQFTGANNPLYIIRNGDLIEIKGDKQPVGNHIKEVPFTLHTYQLEKNDVVYTFSDGYVDQFGGPKGKKFMRKQFKELLIKISSLSLDKQKDILDQTFEQWKGDLDQIDDVCVIGVRI